MDHDPLISICIPTRNNARYLIGCLNSLMPQVRPYEIPIYVSDNASTDNTIEMLSSFKKEVYPPLYYRSNDKNLGFDQNLVNAVKMASSKYVWPLGDRRRLLPNSVKRVYSILGKNDLDLLVLSVAMYYATSVHNKRYTSARDVFLELFSNVGTLSFSISPTKAWMPEILENYIGTGWVHFAAIFEFLAGLKAIDVMFTGWPSIASSGKSGWTRNFFQVWTNWKKTVVALPDVYSKHDKELVIKAFTIDRSISILLDLRSEGVYDVNVYNEYREEFLKYTRIPLAGAKAVSQLPVLFAKPYPVLKRVLSEGLRTLVGFKYPLNPSSTRVLSRLVRERYVEEKKVMQGFLAEVEHNSGLAKYGEKEVRRALEDRAVRNLLLSEGLKQLRIFAKCDVCSYEEQQTVENQLTTRPEQNLLIKHCSKCGTAAFLSITEIQDLTENFVELAEQSSADVEIVSAKTKEGRMLRDSFNGVAAILRSEYQESSKSMP